MIHHQKREFVQPLRALLCFAGLLVLLLLSPEETAYAARGALALCAQTLIPSLLLPLVLSDLLLRTGAEQSLGKLFDPLFRRVFRLSGNAAAPILLGLLCGYPIGAKAVADLAKRGVLTDREAACLLPLAAQGSLPFLVVAVGGGMNGNLRFGWFLFFVQLAGFIAAGIVLTQTSLPRKCNTNTIVCETRHPPFQLSDLSSAIAQAAKSMLTICTSVVFFSALCAAVEKTVSRLFSPGIRIAHVFSVLAEITAALRKITAFIQTTDASFRTLCLLGGTLGFGGLCVAAQAASFLEGTTISMRRYWSGKLLEAFFCAVFCMLFYPLFFR